MSELGDLARQQHDAERASLDDRWDRLAAGTLTAEEDAELKALGESSPEAREAYEAFRPLGADFQARVVNAINAERTTEAPSPKPQEPRPRVLPFRRMIHRAEVWVGFAAAVAAGVFFLVRGPEQPRIPNYEMADLKGDQTNRGSEPSQQSGLPKLSPGSPLTLTATPDTAVQGVEARAFLSSLSGKRDLLPWTSEPRVDPKGTVSLEGTLGKEIQLPAGDWRIWIVVGRKGRIPSVQELQAELQAGRFRDADWQAVFKDLRVKPRASP
ncbi:MAG: hypothetical protein JF614_12450 [Acidobacteria bacterium]|nr:hypothetical protein [Acidobacteriota bacterium]